MSDPSEPPPDDDVHAFRRAVADVRPLTPRSRVPEPGARPGPRARFARAEREEVLRESLVTPLDPAALETGDHLAFKRPAVREEVLRKLKRGQFAVEAEIDLHGLGRHAAHEALREFLNDCVRRGLRCVRVIHGKGLRSGPGGPVLKHVVDHWLRRIENVVAFASARPVDGGTGAVYVLLRK
ncbi:MAG TPA: Smr/MutS family protein [Steroidobacteraceae bacterium]|nr:Smr/MutS family protein [Steroidobacteraceae bacterium]